MYIYIYTHTHIYVYILREKRLKICGWKTKIHTFQSSFAQNANTYFYAYTYI